MTSQQATLFVLHTESILRRGGEKYLFEILARHAKKQHVRLFLYRINSEWLLRYGKAGVSVTLLWRPTRLFWFLLPVTMIVNVWQIKSVISKGDVVFSTNFPMNFIAVLVSKNTISHCFEPLAIFYDDIRIRSLSSFSRLCVRVASFFYSGMDKYAYKKARVLTSLNSSVAEHIIKIYGRKPDVYLSNGVDTAFFGTKGKKLINSKTFAIGHSTDYTVFKGTEDFLEILGELIKHTNMFHAYISESIPTPDIKREYMKKVKRLNLHKHVTFVGYLTENELPMFYRSLDVFVYTGSPECAGGSTASLSVLEAQSCGAPCVRSRGDDEEIQDKKTGYYINPHNHKEACYTLLSYMKQPIKTREEKRKMARMYVKSKYNWKKTERQLSSTIQSLQSHA